MKPEDKKRLEEIRERWLGPYINTKTVQPSLEDEFSFLLTLIDEQEAEVERLKNRQPELPSTGVTENIISEIQRLREALKKINDLDYRGNAHACRAISWAALEGKDES